MGITGIADPADLELEQVPKHLESVTDLTEWYNARLEEAIRMAPEQYWWLHRRWREVPAKILRQLARRKLKQAAKEAPEQITKQGATRSVLPAITNEKVA